MNPGQMRQTQILDWTHRRVRVSIVVEAEEQAWCQVWWEVQAPVSGQTRLHVPIDLRLGGRLFVAVGSTMVARPLSVRDDLSEVTGG